MVASRNLDSMGRVYAIASAKGGVGKTTTTANLGATLAETGAAVVVIDGDIGMANLGAALGVDPTGPTLHDVLADKAKPHQAAYEGPAGLTVVPGDTSLDSFAAAEPQRLDAVVDAFDEADFILIDVGAGVSHETSIPLSVADAVVLVSTAERDALVDTEKTRQLAERLGGVVAGAVITRTDEATPIDEVVSGTLTANVLTTIPDDEAVRESIAVGEPLVSYAPHSEAAAGYRELARQLTGRTPDPPEPSPSELEAETREVLEESDDQLSDSLSKSGITMEPSDDRTAEQSQSEPAASADHNVVNPFAATPEDSPDAPETSTDDTDPETDNPDAPETSTDDTDPETDNPDPDAESKWFDAATGSDIDESTTPSTPDPDDQPDEAESVPADAIPFGGNDDSSSDEDTAETTVLGASLEGENSAAAEAEDGAETDSETEADEPLIPDAEGGTTDQSGDQDDEPTETEISVDEPEDDDDDDDEEKKGFFSRLFR